MNRCRGKLSDSSKCSRYVPKGLHYCHMHQLQGNNQILYDFEKYAAQLHQLHLDKIKQTKSIAQPNEPPNIFLMPLDVIRLIAQHLPATDILHKSTINRAFYNSVCAYMPFWRQRAEKLGLCFNPNDPLADLQKRIVRREQRPRIINVIDLAYVHPAKPLVRDFEIETGHYSHYNVTLSHFLDYLVLEYESYLNILRHDHPDDLAKVVSITEYVRRLHERPIGEHDILTDESTFVIPREEGWRKYIITRESIENKLYIRPLTNRWLEDYQTWVTFLSLDGPETEILRELQQDLGRPLCLRDLQERYDTKDVFGLSTIYVSDTAILGNPEDGCTETSWLGLTHYGERINEDQEALDDLADQFEELIEQFEGEDLNED